MENDRDLMEIVKDMILNGKSSWDLQFFLEDIPFIVTVSISSMEDKNTDDQ
ncbi:hypothetical protein UFOVP1244_83 [uncultured Caudovirales phage]|uniref:Uncharacterized protein n=1 Tax=uncultured Caudovirales phage TaxID=2100421 RepID=A0A6J5RLP7_9CAUD|nr:hypothetical protein UFOVP1244_83 [uncultured Caudovirales phage]